MTTFLLAGRTLRRFWRTTPLVVSTLVFPLVLMFTILAMFGEIVGQDDYIARLAPLIVLSTATYGMPGTALGFFRDAKDGTLDRLRVLPISSMAPLLGRVLGDVARIVCVALLATAVSFVVGFRFSGGLLALPAYFGVVALFGGMCTWISVLVALRGTSEESVESALSAPTTLLFFLSSAFVPLSAFPEVLQPVVRLNPLSFASEALIGLSSGTDATQALLVTVAATLAVSALCAAFAVRRYRTASG